MGAFSHQPLDFPKLADKRVSIEGRRHYEIDGTFYPSVTTVIKDSGINQEGLVKWRKRVGDKKADGEMRSASTRGTSVHDICERYLFDYINDVVAEKEAMEGHNSIARDMFKQIKGVLDERVSLVHNTEFGLWSSRLNTAGSCDLLAIFDDKLSIIDFKTAKKPKPDSYIQNYFLQMTCYAMMAYERVGILPTRIVCIIATNEDNFAQVVVKKTADYVDQTKQLYTRFAKPLERSATGGFQPKLV